MSWFPSREEWPRARRFIIRITPVIIVGGLIEEHPQGLSDWLTYIIGGLIAVPVIYLLAWPIFRRALKAADEKAPLQRAKKEERLRKRQQAISAKGDATTVTLVREAQHLQAFYVHTFSEHHVTLRVARGRGFAARRFGIGEGLVAEATWENERMYRLEIAGVRVRHLWSRRWRQTHSIESAVHKITDAIESWKAELKAHD